MRSNLFERISRTSLQESIPKNIKAKITNTCKNNGLNYINWEGNGLDAADKPSEFVHYALKDITGISLIFTKDTPPYEIHWYCVVVKDKGKGLGGTIVNDILDIVTPCKVHLLDDSGGNFWKKLSISRPDIEWDFAED